MSAPKAVVLPDELCLLTFAAAKISAATDLAYSDRRPQITTLAPYSIKRSAVALPRPSLPPVIKTILPESSKSNIPHSYIFS